MELPADCRPVADAAGYFVTPDGRVFSTRKNRVMCLKPSRHSAGYLMVNLDRRPRSVHRLVATAFLPPPEPGQTHARHLDGNPANNTVGNIAWGTPTDNAADMRRHGRRILGERHPLAKLTAAEVESIKARLAAGAVQVALAEEYGVTKTTICSISRGRSWLPGAKRDEPKPEAQTPEERSASASKAGKAVWTRRPERNSTREWIYESTERRTFWWACQLCGSMGTEKPDRAHVGRLMAQHLRELHRITDGYR